MTQAQQEKINQIVNLANDCGLMTAFVARLTQNISRMQQQMVEIYGKESLRLDHVYRNLNRCFNKLQDLEDIFEEDIETLRKGKNIN